MVLLTVAGLMILLPATTADEAPLPQIYTFPIKNLVRAKQVIAQHAPSTKTPYIALINYANAALSAKPASVMDKPLVAASGNKHDFFSYGPYWWPDPKKPDGLPYIKHDGYVNPKSKIGTDSTAFVHMTVKVEVLAYAYYFTGREAYAAKAAELIRVWFLNPATAMNPSANYGQAVPGVLDGRGEGVIEMRYLIRIPESIALIEPSGAWTKDDRIGFQHWLEQYVDWLTTTKQPIDETSTENNHMSWRDVQLVEFAIVLGKPDQARKLLQEEFPRLLDMQVKSTGEQERELVRINSLNYSLFNLEALFQLAIWGDFLGMDCWKITAKDGGGLHAALDYLAPYIDPGKPWLVQEIRPTDRKRLLPLLAQAYEETKDPKYKELLDKFCVSGPDLWRIIWSYDGVGFADGQSQVSQQQTTSD